MFRNLFSKITTAAALSLLLASAAIAGTPLVLSHQGYLLGAGDAPMEGVVDITYKIYDSPTGGAALWSETHPSVTVTKGLFTSTLGSVVALTADMLTASSGLPGSGPARYLEVVVNGVAITPRSQLVAAPYSVASSRVSGDIETAPQLLTLSDGSHDRAIISALGSVTYVGTWDVTTNSQSRLYTDTDSAGLSVKIDDRYLIGLRANTGINEPLPYTVLHLSDVSGRGTSSLTCTEDSVVNSLTSTDASSGRRKLVFVAGSTGTGSETSSDLDGDGHAERNMRTRINDLESRLSVAADLDDDGFDDISSSQVADGSSSSISVSTNGAGNSKNSANIAAVLNGNTVIGCMTDLDGDGQPEGSINSTVTLDGSASHETSSRGSGGVQARTGEYVGSGATLGRSYCDIDLDGDGISDYSSWQKVDNTGSITAATVDINDDGIPDVGTEISAKVPRSVLKTYFQSGDKPTAGQFLAVSDSSGSISSVEVDLNHDNDPEGSSSMDAKENRAELKTRFENGDIPTDDNFVVTSSDADGAGTSMRAPTALLTWGTGLAFRVDGTGPSMRMDQDSLPTFTVTSTAGSTTAKLNKAIADGDTKIEMSAAQSECRLQLGDANSDGFAEITTSSASSLSGIPQSSSFRMGRPAINTALIQTDPSSSSITLSHASSGPGDKPTAAQFGNLIDSYIHLEDDGVTRFSATSSTGVQLRDQFGNIRTSMTTEGTGMFDQKIGIGKTPTEKIDVAGGAYCDGTNWVNASDKNSKENFQKIDGEELLDKIAALDITKWNYKNDKETEHIGPTAQDFREKFGVGSDGKSISTIDPSGIALAAIKELYSQLKSKEKEIAELRKSNDSELKELRNELAKLRNELKKK